MERKLIFIHKDKETEPEYCMHCGEKITKKDTIIRRTFKEIKMFFMDHNFSCEKCDDNMTFEYQVKKDKVTKENSHD